MSKLFPISRAADPMRDFRRAITVRAIAAVSGDRDLGDVAQQLYGTEADTVMKAVVVPTSTGNAGALLSTMIGPFLRSLRRRSGAAQLIELGIRVDMSGVGSVSFPRLTTDFPNAAWVAEGGPAPVYSGVVAGVTLTPRKLMALSALTRELAETSAESAEEIITHGLEYSAARALDAKLFSTDAATATAPAGLFNGITPTTGAAGGGLLALATDLRTLTAGVTTAGGGGNLAIVVAPPQAMTLRVLGGQLDAPVIVAPGLANGTVAVIDADAFASGFSGDPQVEVALSALVHLEDTAPTDISAIGSPNIVAAPVRSAFQADLHVLRCILRAGWVMRAPAVAFTTSATW